MDGVHFLAVTGIPPQFQDCPDEYRPSDAKYMYCNVTFQNNRCQMLKDLHRAKEFRVYFLAIIPLVLSILTMLLNVAFSAIAVSILFRHGKGSRKRYIFLLSRSVSAAIAQFLFYVVLIAWKTGGFEYYTAAIFLFAGAVTFLLLTGTYLAMTSLLYVAVVHPLYYKTKVTMSRCMGVIGIIWFVAITFSVFVGLYIATLFYPETSPVSCDFDHCQFPFAVVIVIVLTACYFTVLIFYVFMFLRMNYRNREAGGTANEQETHDTTTSRGRNMRAMNRLSWNLLTFTVSKCSILVVCFVALANLKRLSQLGFGRKEPCKTFEHGDLYIQVELLASIAAIIWLIGMLIDPVISIINDPYLLNLMKKSLSKTSHFIGSIRSSRHSKADSEF
ncbi:GPCR protein [Aphelenchoides avenae]|nr:GPCR protein [Aphelenchus avenae]